MAEDDTQPTLHHRRTFSSPERRTYGSDDEPLVWSAFSSGLLIFSNEVNFQPASPVLILLHEVKFVLLLARLHIVWAARLSNIHQIWHMEFCYCTGYIRRTER